MKIRGKLLILSLVVVFTLGDTAANAEPVLTHHWKFDGNGNDSVGNLDLTLLGGAGFGGGVHARSLFLNNTSPMPSNIQVATR